MRPHSLTRFSTSLWPFTTNHAHGCFSDNARSCRNPRDDWTGVDFDGAAFKLCRWLFFSKQEIPERLNHHYQKISGSLCEVESSPLRNSQASTDNRVSLGES